MLGRGLSPRRMTDLVVVALLYVIISAGAFVYIRVAIGSGEGYPSIQTQASAVILAITPTILAVFLIFSAVRFVKEFRRHAWGYRLRARVMMSFILVMGMAALPPVLLLGSLAVEAVEAPGSAMVRAALGDGVDFALFYYAEKEAALRYAAENDVATIISSRGPDAERVLSWLSARDPSICSVELFSGGASIGFAGDETLLSGPGFVVMGRNGFLPRLTVGDASYSRYFARDAGMAEPGGRISAIVSLRFADKVEQAASGMSMASARLESSKRVAGSFTAYLLFFSLCILAPLFGITVLFALSSADRLLRPVAALSEAIARIKSGSRRAPFLAKPGDEAGDLIESLNAMLENQERSRGDELRNEKIGAWRDIARKLAHELRNPLTPIRLSAERVLKRWNASPDTIGDIIEKSMVAIVQETANMESLLTEFRDFARLPEPQKEWMSLKPMVDEAVHLYSASWPSMSIDCESIDPKIVLKADRGYLKQALGNLIANAADATDCTGRVWIRADLVKTAESRYCRIQVRDDGRGIPLDEQDRVFSPYFTTKPGGTGLGLAIVEHIVAAHGGKIRFESNEDSGTVFYINVPVENT